MYCMAGDLTDYILQAYLDAAERLEEGITERVLKNVSGEIDDALRTRFHLPLATVPETLKRICAVMTAYRIAGVITAMDTEAGSGNEWIALQRLFAQSEKELAAIRLGKLDLGLDELGNEETDSDENSIAVVSSKPLFNMMGF